LQHLRRLKLQWGKDAFQKESEKNINMKQLREIAAGSVVTIPLWNDGKTYIVQPTEPNMPVSDIEIVCREDGKEYLVPCQLQGIVQSGRLL
jgi:hypothetical protein